MNGCYHNIAISVSLETVHLHEQMCALTLARIVKTTVECTSQIIISALFTEYILCSDKTHFVFFENTKEKLSGQTSPM